MGADVQEFVDLALELLEENGETSVLRHNLLTPDSSQPWTIQTKTVVDQSVSAVWLDFDEKSIDGTIIKVGDQNVILPAQDVDGNLLAKPDPVLDTIVRENGEVWTIVQTKPLAPSGMVIIYQIHTRQ